MLSRTKKHPAFNPDISLLIALNLTTCTIEVHENKRQKMAQIENFFTRTTSQ
jgi:hypothetical protein